MTNIKPLMRKELISYGMGDFVCNGLFTIMSSYILFFYTDIAGLGLAEAGIIITAARVIEAIVSPFIGMLIDGTRTKYGAVRPYLLSTIPFVSIALILVYNLPSGSDMNRVIYAGITFVCFSILYTVINISYSTLLSCLTADTQQRLRANMYKSIGASLGAFCVTSTILFMVNQLGHGNKTLGFQRTMTGYALIFTILMLICFWNTTERVAMQKEKASFKLNCKAAAKNKHWVFLCILNFIMLTGMMIRSQSTLYYASYFLKNEQVSVILLSTNTFLAFPVALILPKLISKTGIRKSVVAGNILMITGFFMMILSSQRITGILLGNVIVSFGWGIASGMAFIMISQVVDYSEYKTKVRPQGFMTSMVSLSMKAGVAFATVLSAWLLNLSGFKAGQEQNTATLDMIRWNYIGIPLVLSVLSIFLMHFYTLDTTYHTIQMELKKRRRHNE